MKSFFLALGLILSGVLFATDQHVDSLTKRLEVVSGIEKVQTLRALSEALENEGFDDAKVVAEEAIELARSLDNDHELGLSLSNYGIMKDRFGRFSEALIDFLQAKVLLEETGTKSEIATNLYNMGMCYFHLGKGEKGLDICRESLEIFIGEQDSAGVYENLNGIGLIQQEIGGFEEASQAFFQALDWAGNREKSHILGNIGILFFHMNELEKAIDYFQQCYALELAAGAKTDLGYTLTYIASGHYQTRGFDSAVHYFRKSYELNKETGNLGQMQMSLIGLFRSLIQLGETEEVYEAIRNLEEMNYEENRFFQFIPQVKFETFQMLGQIDSANHYMQITLDSAMAIKDWPTAHAVSRGLAGNYGRAQDWKNAAVTMRTFASLKDSLFTSEREEIIQQLNIEYETEKREAEIVNLKVKEDNARFRATAWTIGAVLIALLAAGLLAFQFINNRKNREIKMANLRTEIASDLHDEMGSLLTGISMQAQMLQYETGEGSGTYLNKIVSNSELAIDKMRDVIWSIDSHYDQMGGLVDRMKMHAAELLNPLGIHWEFKVDNWDMDQPMSPIVRQNLYLIFKEAIHNIAKHAPEDRVNISLNKVKGDWELSIQNQNDIETEPRPASDTQGQGLRSMEMRAKRIGANFKLLREAGFQILVQGRAFV